jgi:tetratricopeptide (TPR) repeat protein
VEPLDLDVLEGLGTLVDHSLLQQREEGGESRFSMLQVIREYALERLEASGEADALHRARASYFVALAEREWEASQADDFDEPPAQHFERLEVDLNNLRAALTWLQARAEAVRRTGETSRAKTVRAAGLARGKGGEAPVVQGLRLAGALLWPWAFRGHLGEGLAWLEALLALDAATLGTDGDDAGRAPGALSTARHSGTTWTWAARSASHEFVRGRAWYAGGVLAHWQGDSAQALPMLERSLTIFQALGDRKAAGYALNNLGMALQDNGDLVRARACYEECLALGRSLGARDMVGMPLANLAGLTLASGDLEQAAVYSEEALIVCRQYHYHTGAATSLGVLSAIAWRRGRLSEATALAKESLVLHQAARDERHYDGGLEACAILDAAQGRSERAARLLGAAAAARERIGMRRSMAVSTTDDIEAVAAARAALGEEAWAAAFAAGQALSLEEAIAEALDASAQSAIQPVEVEE